MLAVTTHWIQSLVAWVGKARALQDQHSFHTCNIALQLMTESVDEGLIYQASQNYSKECC